MQDFEDIRPYRDAEVPDVVARLSIDAELNHAVCVFLVPKLVRLFPALVHWLMRCYLRVKSRRFRTVKDFQTFLSGYMERLVADTVADLSVDGLEHLDRGHVYLFISNHRDIFMDAGLVNFVIRRHGHDTARSAVGDNLLARRFAADLMRLNKSFVVERSASGARAVYAALTRTSEYIRHSLEEGHSVWIAQREGRSKDGYDRTDPALIKMLALAHRGGQADLSGLVRQMRIVPVAISYELDPCDRLKAHELFVTDRDGSYSKPPDEDLHSIVEGMTGFKGRIHLHFASPLEGEFADADAVARAIDREIVTGLRVFPTQLEAARKLGVGRQCQVPDALPEVESEFSDRLQHCPEVERPYLLAGYANLLRNRAEFNVG
jgi:1-acyl-sn-glycerol-3-phosphate acyltransferase